MRGNTRPFGVTIPKVVTHHVPFKPKKEKQFIIGVIEEITPHLATIIQKRHQHIERNEMDEMDDMYDFYTQMEAHHDEVEIQTHINQQHQPQVP